jgi:hypothetical protein
MTYSRILSIFLFAATVAAGCSPATKTTRETRAAAIDTNAETISRIRTWLSLRSASLQSLSVEGNLSFTANGESNSATFALKSKRLDPSGNRIDSLSTEVFGPLGIKVARFLASPMQYQFYNILQGETVSGATDAKSLEALTHLNGVSLSAMTDMVYGLANIDPADSLRLFSDARYHSVIVQRRSANVTFVLSLTENDAAGPTDKFTLVSYRRWNGLIDPPRSSAQPVVTVRFSDPIMYNGLSVPQKIEANAGANTLKMEYTTVEINPPSLVVRIKMP